MSNISIIKNQETSSKCFANYKIIRDNKFIGSAILINDTNIVEVFKKHNENITNKEYKYIINNIKEINIWVKY